jgi:intracellular septation protein A
VTAESIQTSLSQLHGLHPAELRRAALPAIRRLCVAGIFPVLSFYVLLRLSGPIAGIVGGTAAGLLVLWLRIRQTRRIDPVVIAAMMAVLIQGGAGLLTGSVWAYLAAPIVENTFWGLVLCGSVLVGRPLIGLIANELQLVPHRFRGHPKAEQAFAVLTLMWGIAAFAKVGLRVALLSTEQTVESFLILMIVGTNTLNVGLLLASFLLPLRWLRRPA